MFQFLELTVPVLVVPDTDLNRYCPVVVIRCCKSAASGIKCPEPWQLAFDSFVYQPVTVRSRNEHTIEVGPYESVSLHGIVRGLRRDVRNVVTEPLFDEGPLLVRPGVLKVPRHGV